MRALRICLLGLALTGCSTTALPSTEEPAQRAVTGCSDRKIYARTGARLVEYDALGNARERFAFGGSQGEIEPEVGLSRWSAQGEFLAASMLLRVTVDAPSTHEIVLLDRDTVKFQAIYPGGSPQLFLSADGSLAVSGSRNFLRRVDGSLIELGAYEPLGPLRTDGSLPASLGPPNQATSPKGLLWPMGPTSTWQFDRFDDPVPTFANLRATSRQLVYFRASEDEPSVPTGRLVAIGVDRVTRVELPGAPQLVDVADDRWVLLADWQASSLTLVDLATGHVTRIENDAPLHFELASATVDEAGHVFTSVVRQAQLQLVRTDDGGKTFVDVGSPMQPGELGFAHWLAPIVHQGSALTLNLSEGHGKILNEVQFATDRTRAVIPSGHYLLGYTPDGAQADLTRDGQCAASWVLNDGASLDDPARYSLIAIDHDGPRVVATSSFATPTVSFAK